MIELTDEVGWSFEELLALNAGMNFSHYDYARVLRQSGHLSVDRLIQWLRSYEPPMITYSGRLFLGENFSASKYKEMLVSGSKVQDAQLFINLINVSDILGREAETNCELIADEISATWNFCLKNAYPSALERARVIREEDEFYVSMYAEG